MCTQDTPNFANENVSAVYNIDGMVPRILVPAAHAEQARQIIAENQQASPDAEDDLESDGD